MEFKYQLGFIGAGNMAKAIAQGILRNKILNKDEIIMSATKSGIYNGIKVVDYNKEVVEYSKCLIIAVKPQIFDSIINEINMPKSEIIVSIMAGKTSDKIKDALKAKCPIIRIMPNTPCMVGKGMSVIANNNATENQNQFISNIFKSIGEVEYLDEKLFDAMTSVSGSGPAYVYYFIKSMVEGGVAGGLDYDTSLKLTLQTISGGVEMVKNTTDSLDDLIQKVCSKGGTTIQAIDTFNSHNMLDIIKDGMLKCKARSEELSK